MRRETARGSIGVAAIGGRTTFGSSEEARPVFAASAIATQRRGSVALLLSAGRAFVGDTQYGDIGMTARGQYHKSCRNAARRAGMERRRRSGRVWRKAAACRSVSDGPSWFRGRYPSDPIRGSIAGLHLSASMRLHLHSPARPVSPLPVHHSGATGEDPPPTTMLTLTRQSPGYVKLVLQTPPASSVEIAGDFTLASHPGSTSRGRHLGNSSAHHRGVHQINLRLDGPWTAPGGTDSSRRDYGDEVGTFVVP
jgi:hypothetical protein